MAKQIITLEITFTLDKLKASGGGFPFPAWLSGTIRRAGSWVTSVEVLNLSPVSFGADEDEEEFRPYLVDKPESQWRIGG